jgi:predicted DCC family thiol-disulfide oxidoreductase YuxK
MPATDSSRWTMIYDGDCHFCRRQVRFIERWGRARRIEPVALQAADLERFGITRGAAEEAMHVVSPAGEVSRGAAAAVQVMRLLPGLRPLVWMFRLPGAMPAAEHVYRWVARRRHRFGCSSAACRRGLG